MGNSQRGSEIENKNASMSRGEWGCTQNIRYFVSCIYEATRRFWTGSDNRISSFFASLYVAKGKAISVAIGGYFSPLRGT
jgi:hypothetical protein